MRLERGLFTRGILRILRSEFVKEVRGQSQDNLMVASSRSSIIGGIGVAILLTGIALDNGSVTAGGFLASILGFEAAAVTSAIAARRSLRAIS